MLDALAQLPLLEQKDILISELLSSREKDIAMSIQDTEVQSGMYEIPYSYIRFGDVDRFTAAINAICPLSEKAELFVRRNFNNYYSKQNHLMMHDPELYVSSIKRTAFVFLSKAL